MPGKIPSFIKTFDPPSNTNNQIGSISVYSEKVSDASLEPYLLQVTGTL